jgi:hypothetical protein
LVLGVSLRSLAFCHAVDFVQAFETRQGFGGHAFVFVHGFLDGLDFDFESGDGLAAFGRGVSDPGEEAKADGREHGVEEIEFHFIFLLLKVRRGARGQETQIPSTKSQRSTKLQWHVRRGLEIGAVIGYW